MPNLFPVICRLYTETPEKKPIYLGKCICRRKSEGLCLHLSQRKWRLSATGKFFLHLPKRFVRRHEGEAVKVCVGKKAVVVPLQLVIAIEGKIC